MKKKRFHLMIPILTSLLFIGNAVGKGVPIGLLNLNNDSIEKEYRILINCLEESLCQNDQIEYPILRKSCKNACDYMELSNNSYSFYDKNFGYEGKDLSSVSETR